MRHAERSQKFGLVRQLADPGESSHVRVHWRRTATGAGRGSGTELACDLFDGERFSLDTELSSYVFPADSFDRPGHTYLYELTYIPVSQYFTEEARWDVTSGNVVVDNMASETLETSGDLRINGKPLTEALRSLGPKLARQSGGANRRFERSPARDQLRGPRLPAM